MNALAKITNLAKGLQQRDPRLTWKAAIKKASQMYRSNQDAGVELASRKLGAKGIGSGRKWPKVKPPPPVNAAYVLAFVNIQMSHELKDKHKQITNINEALRIAKKYADKWKYDVYADGSGYRVTPRRPDYLKGTTPGKKSMTLTGPQLITFVNTLLAYEIADNDFAEFMTVPQAIKAVKPYGIKVVKRGTKYVLSE